MKTSKKPRKIHNFNLLDFPPDVQLRFKQHCERNDRRITEIAVPLFRQYLDQFEFTDSPFKSSK